MSQHFSTALCLSIPRSRLAGILSVLLVLGLGAGMAHAAPTPQQGFDARVVDGRTGQPVIGAEVTIIGESGSVKTDSDGRFRWRAPVEPPFILIVMLPGGLVARPVDVTSVDTRAVLTVTIEAAVTEDVTVAAGAAPSIDVAPGAGMTMLSARDVALRSPANLLQALESVPGVNQVSEGQAAVPAVRGLARGRTLILIDGSRITAERRVGPSATFLDPSIVEGVDVARGPASVAYGSDAFGGVISVRTNRPGYVGTKATFSGTLGAGVPDRRGEVGLSHGFGDGGILLQVHARDVEDYDGPDGPVINSGWGDRGALARVERRFGRGLFGASWQGDFGRDIERPRSNSNVVRYSYPYEDSQRFNVSYEQADVGPMNLIRLHGFVGTYKQRTDQNRFPTATSPRDIERADLSANDFQVRALAEQNLGGMSFEWGLDLNGRYGLEARDIFIQYDLDGNIVESLDNLSTENARRTDTGLFAQVSAPLTEAMTLGGGLRFDYVRTVNDGGYFGSRSVSHGAAAGFAALTVRTSDRVTLTAQLSRGFRDPTISDRFYRGPTGRGFVTGNPDLEPETSLQLDLGARYSASRLRFAGYFYNYRFRNLVERFEADEDFFFFRNRGRARIRGVEFEAQADIGNGVWLEASAQVSRGRALDDDDALDDIAPDTIGFTVRRAFLERFAMFARLARHAEDDRPGPGEIEAPGHTNLDVGGSWFASERVEVRGAIRNLLNDTYYASPDRRFVYAPGVNGFVTVAITLQ